MVNSYFSDEYDNAGQLAFIIDLIGSIKRDIDALLDCLIKEKGLDQATVKEIRGELKNCLGILKLVSGDLHNSRSWPNVLTAMERFDMAYRLSKGAENTVIREWFKDINTKRDLLRRDITSAMGASIKSQQKSLQSGETKDQSQPSEEKTPEKPINPYREIDFINRTLTIGDETHKITSVPVWGFLTTLVSNMKQEQVTPQQDGLSNWKNAIDLLRRQIGKDEYHQIVIAKRGLYWLVPSVKIKHDGQIGIRKTKLTQKKSKSDF